MVETYAPGDYHGHQQVFAIAQSSLGLVYFSNFGEVIEYDGARWRGIGVPTSWIRELAADDAGRIWLGGTDELGWCEANADGTTVYHSLVEKLPEHARPLGTVWSVAWYDHAVWFATDHQILRWRNGQFDQWSFPVVPRQRLRAGGHHLWLTRRGDGLYRWNGRDWQLASRAAELTEQPVEMIIDDPGEGPSIIGMGDGKLWSLTPAGILAPFATALAPTLAGTRITGGARLKSGLLALSTHGQGVLVLDAKGGLVQRVAEAEGLPSSSAYRVTEDREGGVWIGTSMGAARVELGSPYSLFDKENGRGAVVALQLQRSNGVLYIGSEEGVRRLVSTPGSKAHFEPVPGGRQRVFAMMPYEDGLLVGTEAGLARMVGDTLKVEVRTPIPVLGLGRSKSAPDRIFVGFPETARTYRRTATGEWIDEGPIAAFSGEARTLVETPDNSLWIGTTQRGYARVTRGAGQTWQNSAVEFFRGDRGLPADPGWVRVVDAPGGPWFSTGAGLFIFDVAKKLFLPAPPLAENKMAGLYTWPVASAREGELWAQVAASGDPLDLEHPEVGRLLRNAAGRWEWHTLPTRIINHVGYFGFYEMLVEPGVIWLSGQSAVVRVETDHPETTTSVGALPLRWRRISRGDQGALPLTGPPPRLPFSKDPLRVEFAQPGFSAGRSTAYSYRLLGFNDAWSDWRGQAEFELMGLSAGKYTLEVRSKETTPGSGTLSYSFRIAPPWYFSILAIVAYCAGAAGLFMGYVRWREQALRKTKVDLEKLVAERTLGLQEASERAETASRSKTLFLASVSHELRTPLHAILGYSQLLENDVTLGATTRDRLRVVGASGRHLLRLINEVLDLSKIEAGKQELRVEVFSLPALLTEVTDAQETRAHVKGLALRRQDPTALPESVMGDASKLRQVLDNLVGNAVKFTQEGEVSLKVTAASGRVRFEVADTGPGISADDQLRLFQPFHQAGSARLASVERGTGLGLAITQRLVRLMGGEVQLASEIGRGSRFWFELELSSVGTPAVALERVRNYRGRGRRILVVDDIAVNRHLLRELLEPIGFVVSEAEGAEEAWRSLNHTPVDLMILDLRLPGMSGLELARQLRATPEFAGLPILAASASALDLDPRVAMEAGCNDFLAKPFLVEELTAKISRLLDPPDPTARGSGAAFAGVAWSDSGLLRALHAAAQEGDVLRVHEEIGRLRNHGAPASLLDEIERRTKAFDVDGIVAITTVYLKDHPPLDGR